MDPISILEKRIEALELQVLPSNRSSLTPASQAITDLLLQTQTMVTSALSCREGITSILEYTSTINDYLDPSSGGNVLEVEAKRLYLLEIYPDIKDNIQTISALESLVPFIDSGNIAKLVELCGKLEQLSASSLNAYEESRQVTFKVLKSLQMYNDIITSIKLLFVQLDKAVSDLENALQPKFLTEE